MEHKNFQTKPCVFTAPDAHSAYGHIMHTSLRYTRTSIQPADKQIEQSRRTKQKRSMFIAKQPKGDGEDERDGGRKGTPQTSLRRYRRVLQSRHPINQARFPPSISLVAVTKLICGKSRGSWDWNRPAKSVHVQDVCGGHQSATI